MFAADNRIFWFNYDDKIVLRQGRNKAADMD